MPRSTTKPTPSIVRETLPPRSSRRVTRSKRAGAESAGEIPEASLEAAIARGRQMVLSRQRPDGSFQERGDMGPFTTALALVSLHNLEQLPPDDLADGARWLRSRQMHDGSFAGRPFATAGDLSATATAWAALSLSKRESDRDAAERARGFVERSGGAEAVLALAASGDVSALVLAMAGQIDASRIASFPLSTLLVPTLVERLAQRIVFYGLSTSIACALIARELGRGRAPRGMLRGLLDGRENARAVELLTLYQNQNGSLMNVVYHTALLAPALRAAGVPGTDPRLANAVAWLRSRGQRDEGGLFFDVYGSDVWSTASYLRTLLLSGSSRREEPVLRAVSWLLDQQCRRPHPIMTNPSSGAPRTGGWGFQAGEDAYPDCDTTSAVLDALGRALVADAEGEESLPAALATRVCAAIASARTWLLAMQNDDGGWPSFFRGHPTKRPGPIMTRPMNLRLRDLPADDPGAWMRVIVESAEHLSDPSTEDVTSRVVAALARTGTDLRSREARRALEFLRAQQCPNGAWWGRWKVNFLPVTAGVLSAYARLGHDLSRDDARRAVSWITEHQNSDGGFGETIESYRDPSLAGCGPSTAPLTGSVLLGLVDAGEGRSRAAARAAEYLLARQQPDGAWPNGDCVATLVPPKLFYEYGGAARYIPLEALASYARAVREHAAPTRGGA